MIDKKTGEVIIDAFGIVAPSNTKATVCNEHEIKQYDYKLNKEKGLFEIVETDPVDLTEMIESNMENCGMNLALLNIARGTSPDKYRDDGKHGGDFSGSTNINVCYQESLNNKAVAEKLAKELGIDNYEDFTTVESVMTFFKAKQEALAIKANTNPVPSEGGNK